MMPAGRLQPLRPHVIEAHAPVRVCDNGGWTDTWFGAPGSVFNVAVAPGVFVTIDTFEAGDGVVLDVADFGERYAIVPGAPRVPRHPLLEAAVDALPPPPGLAVEIGVRSAVPSGCGTGTSAAVAVALLAALGCARGEQRTPLELAHAAHRLEVDALGEQSGIQDQICAAFGGINYLEIGPYPETTVERLPAWDDLGAGLSLVFLGRPHDSSALHSQVIEALSHGTTEILSRLRAAARQAREAVMRRDLDALGRSMVANTEAQRRLHPALVGLDAQRLIDLSRSCGALGWKVNGAGGDGGSLTVLSATAEQKMALEAAILESAPAYRILPVRVSEEGVTVRGAP